MSLERFIMKTHTEALRPGNFSILISKCTSHNESSYVENIEEKLAEYLKNKSATKFALMIATKRNRGFGFLLDNMIWSWKGFLIDVILKYVDKSSNDRKDYYSLFMLEKIMYLRFFLETEGAFIIKLAERFKNKKQILKYYLKEEIEKIFKEIYEEYLEIESDFEMRIRFQKRINEINITKYSPGTINHKIEPHIQAFSDLGLLEIFMRNGDEVYKPIKYNHKTTFDILLDNLINIAEMENFFNNSNYYEIVSKIYNLKPKLYSSRLHEESLKEVFLWGYNKMSKMQGSMVYIKSLYEWCIINLLSEKSILTTSQNIDEFITRFRKNNPSALRYHLNGSGEETYLILDV